MKFTNLANLAFAAAQAERDVEDAFVEAVATRYPLEFTRDSAANVYLKAKTDDGEISTLLPASRSSFPDRVAFFCDLFGKRDLDDVYCAFEALNRGRVMTFNVPAVSLPASV